MACASTCATARLGWWGPVQVQPLTKVLPLPYRLSCYYYYYYYSPSWALASSNIVLKHVASNFWSYSTGHIFWDGGGSQPNTHCPTQRTRISLFVGVITYVLSGMGIPTSSYATASIALGIIWPNSPHHYLKVRDTFVGGYCISECKSAERNDQQRTL